VPSSFLRKNMACAPIRYSPFPGAPASALTKRALGARRPLRDPRGTRPLAELIDLRSPGPDLGEGDFYLRLQAVIVPPYRVHPLALLTLVPEGHSFLPGPLPLRKLPNFPRFRTSRRPRPFEAACGSIPVSEPAVLGLRSLETRHVGTVAHLHT